jgi:hypothetical protein
VGLGFGSDLNQVFANVVFFDDFPTIGCVPGFLGQGLLPDVMEEFAHERRSIGAKGSGVFGGPVRPGLGGRASGRARCGQRHVVAHILEESTGHDSGNGCSGLISLGGLDCGTSLQGRILVEWMKDGNRSARGGRR